MACTLWCARDGGALIVRFAVQRGGAQLGGATQVLRHEQRTVVARRVRCLALPPCATRVVLRRNSRCCGHEP